MQRSYVVRFCALGAICLSLIFLNLLSVACLAQESRPHSMKITDFIVNASTMVGDKVELKANVRFRPGMPTLQLRSADDDSPTGAAWGTSARSPHIWGDLSKASSDVKRYLMDNCQQGCTAYFTGTVTSGVNPLTILSVSATPAATESMATASSSESAAGAKQVQKAVPPSVVGIALGMPFVQARKVADGLYKIKDEHLHQWEHRAGPAFLGAGWSREWKGQSDAIELASTQKGIIYFVERFKALPYGSAQPTWESVRKALVAQYGEPTTEAFSSGNYFLSWFYGPQWQKLNVESVPEGCKELPKFEHEGDYKTSWVPRSARSGCPAIMSYLGSPDQSDSRYIVASRFELLNEPAMIPDIIEINEILKREDERKYHESNKVAPTF
jgi:hypothetical protein